MGIKAGKDDDDEEDDEDDDDDEEEETGKTGVVDAAGEVTNHKKERRTMALGVEGVAFHVFLGGGGGAGGAGGFVMATKWGQNCIRVQQRPPKTNKQTNKQTNKIPGEFEGEKKGEKSQGNLGRRRGFKIR